jgi:hypothetical protein
MTLVEIVTMLRSHDVLLTACGDRLRVNAPAGVVSDEMRQAMRQHKQALLALLAQPAPAHDAPTTAPSTQEMCPHPAPLTLCYPCVVCGSTGRWDDCGVWRCRRCWSAPLTDAARLATQREQARLTAQAWEGRPQERPAKLREPGLGPILPPCTTCGALRYWHDHDADSWHCWTCTPPAPRRPPPAVTTVQEGVL